MKNVKKLEDILKETETSRKVQKAMTFVGGKLVSYK